MGEISIKDFGKIKISEIMSREPLFFVTPEDKISKTELLMLKKKVGGLPVVSSEDHKRVIGIITQRDIRLARFAMSLDNPYTVVRDLMTPEPHVVKESTTIKELLEIMFKYRIGRLPVVDDNNELIGIVLQSDILKKLFEFLNE
ncbi:MAG: CBS domain-containing protein [Promethearchaeota archaeon]